MSEFDYDLDDELVTKFIKVTLSNNANYTTRFSIQGIEVNMLCNYNSRNKSRSVTLTDKYGNVMLSQTFVRYGKRCELNRIANEYGLDYYVTVVPKDLTKKDWDKYDYFNWAYDFDLFFVGHSYSLTERLRKNFRRMYVGN